MANFIRTAAALAVAALLGCSSAPSPIAHSQRTPCGGRALTVMAANDAAVREHRYAQASATAERAARISLACGDRWRAANALIVAAELAHQSGNAARARGLVHEGFGIMRALRRTIDANDVDSTLLAEKLDGARRDMQGRWVYW